MLNKCFKGENMIKIETFCDHFNNANTYLITNDNDAIIIDPANNTKTLKKYIDDKKVVAILLTHGHYDHFKSLRELIKIYDVKIYLHKEAYKKLNDINLSFANAFGCNNLEEIKSDKCEFVNDGQTLKINEFEIKIKYLPGHTNCSVAYIIENNMFVGDVVFRNSIGRTDLPTGKSIAMMESINYFKRLKTNYNIYPGHDEETCVNELFKINPYFR